MKPIGIHCVVPSTVAVGEPFAVKVKILGPVRKIECRGQFCNRKPELRSPFNLNVERQIQYHDNCLPEWAGSLAVDAGPGLSGSAELHFDGKAQGVFPGDTRPIKVFPGFSFQSPGFHFIRVIDKESGVEGVSNPVYVTEEEPEFRIFWGDPHWQTFFSDGIRCPEELYAFARDEAFLDFGAISDHMEAVTDRQWDYFQSVTNDFNELGRFATLIGQEWTNHNLQKGAPGHRNIYFRGDSGPAFRSNDADCDTLEKLWQKLAALPDQDILAIPHHSANVQMGVDWEQGWNPKYEKAVEIHSVWGSSEKHKDDGNSMPIEHCGGEKRGRHVVDALKLGYKLGFVGGGDIHDGRPGEPLLESTPPRTEKLWPCGYTAVLAPTLSKSSVFDAIKDRQTYATTQSRIFLAIDVKNENGKYRLGIKTASEESIQEVAIIINGEDWQKLQPDGDKRVLIRDNIEIPCQPGDFVYIRVLTGKGNLAWSSPFFTD